MSNKKDIVKRFIGVASTVIAHKILVESELEFHIRDHYLKEIDTSIKIAQHYRSRINPVFDYLPDKYSYKIRERILRNVSLELKKRKELGYNVDLSLIEDFVDKFIEQIKIKKK